MSEQLTAQSSRHLMHVQRYAGYLANLFNPYIERLKSDVRKIMSEAPETLKNQRKIERLIREIANAQLLIFGEFDQKVLISEFNEFAVSESLWEIKSLESSVNGAKLTIPSPAHVWAGVESTPLIFESSNKVRLLEPFIKDFNKSEINRVSDAIRIGYITGQTTDQISRNATSKNGVIDKIVRRNTRAMVRTATNHVSMAGRLQSLAANSDIVKGYRLVTTFDSRTTDICRAYGEADKVYLWTDAYNPLPPFHINCRTGIVPVLFDDDESDGFTKASKGDEGGQQIDASESQYAWLKKQSRAFQEDAIGATKAKLLRDGGLTSKEFGALTVDELFRPITLAEMKKKNPLAFELAGL